MNGRVDLTAPPRWLQERKGPTRMEDIIIQGEIPDLETNLEMFEAFSKHERVRYDEKTQLWNYKVGCAVRVFDDIQADPYLPVLLCLPCTTGSDASHRSIFTMPRLYSIASDKNPHEEG